MTAGHGVTSSRRQFLGGCATAAAAGLAGCLVRGENRNDLSGQITVDGSDTVFPHSAATAEEFVWRNNRVRIPISGSGTGAGFRRFCDAETDVQNASRAILDGEIDDCNANGVEYLELATVVDGIAIWVDPDNTWCDELTVEQLAAIWESGSEIETWQDVDPDWPDEEIELYGRDNASGTFDYFTENVTGQIGNIRSDYQASSDTNVIVRGVRGNRYALGWGGAGYYYENEDDLKLVGIDAGDGPVRPTTETIESGEYRPLSRDMYTYVDVEALQREEVQAFLRFYFEPIDEDGREIGVEEGFMEPDEELAWTQWSARRVGYYGIPDEAVEEQSAVLEEAIAEVSE